MAKIIQPRFGLFLIIMLTILVLSFEPFIVEYTGGHFGWVSLHSLSIVKNTRPETFFVGYACQFENGFRDYFSRYAIFFNVFTKYLLLPFESSSALHLFLSRQLMNLIYVATVVIVFNVAKNFLRSNINSLLVALLATSGWLTLRYKNMFHFDQPGVLAFFVFILILSSYSFDQLYQRKTRFLLLVALLSLMARAHIIAFACLIWVGLEFILLMLALRTDASKNLTKEKNSFMLSLFTLLTSASSLAISILFNVCVEAYINGVSLLETSVFDSMISRTGIRSEDAIENIIFLKQELFRFSFNFIPESLDDPLFWRLRLVFMIITPILFIGVLVVISTRCVKEESTNHKDKVLLLLFCAPILWLVVMKNLAYAHEFTSMYYLGTYSAFWIFCMSRISNIKLQMGLLSGICLIFVLSLAHIRQINSEIKNPIFYETLDEFSQTLKVENYPSVYAENGYYVDETKASFIDHNPYALCYFLTPSRIARTSESAAYILEKNSDNYTLVKK